MILYLFLLFLLQYRYLIHECPTQHTCNIFFCTIYFPRIPPLNGLHPKDPIQPEKQRTLLHFGQMDKSPKWSWQNLSQIMLLLSWKPSNGSHLTQEWNPGSLPRSTTTPPSNPSHTLAHIHRALPPPPLILSQPCGRRQATLLRPLVFFCSLCPESPFARQTRGLLPHFFYVPPQVLTTRKAFPDHSLSIYHRYIIIEIYNYIKLYCKDICKDRLPYIDIFLIHYLLNIYKIVIFPYLYIAYSVLFFHPSIYQLHDVLHIYLSACLSPSPPPGSSLDCRLH